MKTSIGVDRRNATWMTENDLEYGIDASATAFATEVVGGIPTDPVSVAAVIDAALEESGYGNGTDTVDCSKTAFAADLVAVLLDDPRSVPRAD